MSPSHPAKSKSISALSLTSIRPHHPTPSTSITEPLPASQSFSSVVGSRATSARVTSISSAMLSPVSRVVSPSSLPPTDSLSYFPPFETMGSSTDDDSDQGSSRARLPGERRGHGQGRSLGSLAGIMSASFSWGLSSLASSSSSSSPQLACSDNEAVQALTKRCAPGKRRVLEPLTLATKEDVEIRRVSLRRRRSKSEEEVENMTQAVTSPSKEEVGEDDEDLVEGLVGEVRPHLPSGTLTTPQTPPPLIPSMPHIPPQSFQWRFPLPSPPITSLSLHIPSEAFRIEVDNPLTSREDSPSPVTPDIMAPDEDVDEVDAHLSPTSAGDSRPSTPPRHDIKYRMEVKGSHTGEPLERTTSRLSVDSKRTVREGEGETTPKIGKGWRGVDEDVVVGGLLA